MINNIECAVVDFKAAAYENVDSIVIMLCKECTPGVAKINSIFSFVSFFTNSLKNLPGTTVSPSSLTSALIVLSIDNSKSVALKVR